MKLRIICYHYIYSEENPYLSRGVHIDEFEEHLTRLKKQYSVIHFSDLQEIESDREMCIITFDDGLKECYTKVFPVLTRLHVKAVFFISSKVYSERAVLTVQKSHMLTQKLGSDEFRNKFYTVLNARYAQVERRVPEGVHLDEVYPYDTDVVRKFKLDVNYTLPIPVVDDVISTLFHATFELPEDSIAESIYITDKELREMSQSELIEFGAHTHSHSVLSRLSRDDQAREIRLSLDYLQNTIGHTPPLPFAYPFGRKGTYNQVTKDILAKDGRVRWACSMQRRNNLSLEDRFEIHRFDVNDFFRAEGNHA